LIFYFYWLLIKNNEIFLVKIIPRLKFFQMKMA